jgi:hypothetical protein
MFRAILSGAIVSLALLVPGCDSDDGGDEPAAQRERGASTGTNTTTGPTPDEGIAGTVKVDKSGKPAAKAVRKAAGREVDLDQPSVIGARCGDGRCVVRYRSEPRGRGVVLDGQSDILRRLFADRSVKSVVLYVHHKNAGSPAKSEAAAFATTTCVRNQHPGFRWAKIGPGDVTRVCRSTHVAGGRQRSLVSRGQLSSEDASRGKGEPGNSGKP